MGMLQIITGIFLALHYTSDLNSAYFSVFFLIREVYYGWCLRYFHSSGASFVFLFLFLHLGRAMFYGSYFYNPNTWFSGIVIFLLLMAIAFMGYVLPFGRMGFWRILCSQSNIEEVFLSFISNSHFFFVVLQFFIFFIFIFYLLIIL